MDFLIPDRYCAVDGLATSSKVRPAVLPVAAYTSANREISPLLLNSGWVCPNSKDPQRGKPREDQPLELLAILRTSAHPIGFFPHPNVSAMGLHIAITTGERTRLSVEATRSFPVFYPRLGIS